MAADLRRSSSRACRTWLEATLLDLEGRNVLEATKEQYPPHYHVALFPAPYLRSINSGELPRVEVASADVPDDPPARHRCLGGGRYLVVAAGRRRTRPPARPQF